MTRLCCWVSLAAGLAACKSDEVIWVPFNAPDQIVEVLVEDGCANLPDDQGMLELLSSLEKRHVGDAIVTPPCGPVGTEHELAVEVFDEWQELVGRVTVNVVPEAVSDLDGDGDQDGRGEDEYELRQDSADIGVWAIKLQSLGERDEVRVDQFQVVLWQPEELQETTAVVETTE